jgi:hypothetical protein
MVLKEFGRNLEGICSDTNEILPQCLPRVTEKHFRIASDSADIRIEDLSYTSLNTENTWMKIIVFNIYSSAVSQTLSSCAVAVPYDNN